MMIGNRKKEGRVCTVLSQDVRNYPKPSENRLRAILNLKKALVHPGIRAQPAQTECHRSTTCATTNTTSKRRLALPFVRQRSLALPTRLNPVGQLKAASAPILRPWSRLSNSISEISKSGHSTSEKKSLRH